MVANSSNHSDKLGLCVAWSHGINCLARTGRNGLKGQRDRVGRDKGGVGVLTVVGDGSGAPPLDL